MKKILLFLISIFPLISFGQWAEDYYQPVVQPRFYVGGDAAAFRISLRSFKDVYENKWNDSYGGFIGVRAFGSHYVMARYGVFEQVGKQGIHLPTGANMADARWEENWVKLGLRIHPPAEKKWGSYYGFGLGFYNVMEKEPISVFDIEAPQKESPEGTGSGFYLEFGIDYFVFSKLSAFFDVEVSSGGTRGRSSFEAMSVGGWRFSAGIVVWPF